MTAHHLYVLPGTFARSAESSLSEKGDGSAVRVSTDSKRKEPREMSTEPYESLPRDEAAVQSVLGGIRDGFLLTTRSMRDANHARQYLAEAFASGEQKFHPQTVGGIGLTPERPCPLCWQVVETGERAVGFYSVLDGKYEVAHDTCRDYAQAFGEAPSMTEALARRMAEREVACSCVDGCSRCAGTRVVAHVIERPVEDDESLRRCAAGHTWNDLGCMACEERQP